MSSRSLKKRALPRPPPRCKVRKKWVINPKTRVAESRKVYSRKKVKARFEYNVEHDGDEEA